MPAALRPSDDFKNKTNVNPSVDRSTEATAEDFQEAGQILDDHAARLDELQRADELAPFYGFFTSLEVLIASFPEAESNAFAVIDPGNGNPQQIAKWENDGWSIPDAIEQLLYFNSRFDFPETGLQKHWYIALDSGKAFLWINNQYREVGADGSNGLSAYEIALTYGFEGTEEEWLNSLKGYFLTADFSLYINQNNEIRQNVTDFDQEIEWHSGDPQIFPLIEGVTWIRGVFRQGQKLRPVLQWRLLQDPKRVEILNPLVDGDFISIEVQHYINIPEA